MSLRFSQDIKLLLTTLANRPIAISEILQQTGERGFCFIISLLVLPFLFPMPPGLSTPLGSACLLLGMQMALGHRSPWLPAKISRLRFPQSLSRVLLQNIQRLTNRLEKIIRSRWEKIARKSYTWKANGFCIAWLSVLLMLPIPFTNPLPAIAILLLAVSTIENDGLIMGVGYFLTLINTLFFGFLGYAIWQAPQLLPNLFR